MPVPMVYLFLGPDLTAKDKAIAQLKASLIKDDKAVYFDVEHLDALGLPADALKKALITLPVMSPKRLVILRNVHKLKTADIAVLTAFVNAPSDKTELILESHEGALKADFKAVVAKAKVTVTGALSQDNVFDMTKLMQQARLKEALGMLDRFYGQGTHPLQIMGGLVWFWGKEGRHLPKDRFERGLKALEEADVNIKRSRFNPNFAVEKLVVELTGLLTSRSA